MRLNLNVRPNATEKAEFKKLEAKIYADLRKGYTDEQWEQRKLEIKEETPEFGLLIDEQEDK